MMRAKVSVATTSQYPVMTVDSHKTISVAMMTMQNDPLKPWSLPVLLLVLTITTGHNEGES
jgi:hypothetical protein